MGASVYNDKIARILILNSSPVLSTFDMCPCMATGYGSVTSLGNRNFSTCKYDFQMLCYVDVECNLHQAEWLNKICRK